MLKITSALIECYKRKIALMQKTNEMKKLNKIMQQNPDYKIVYHDN